MIELVNSRPSLDAIAAAISAEVQIDVRHFLLRCRKPPLPECRHLFAVIAYDFGYTYQAIGDFLGGRDHTTIIANVRDFRYAIKAEPALTRLYDRIINALTERPFRRGQIIFSLKEIERIAI